jgi:hypothetical protein
MFVNREPRLVSLKTKLSEVRKATARSKTAYIKVKNSLCYVKGAKVMLLIDHCRL